MKFEATLQRTLGAFAAAKSAGDYRAAKRMGAGLPGKLQLSVVDAAIACRRRLESEGVL